MVGFGQGAARYPDLKPGRHQPTVPPVSGAVAQWDASVASAFTLANGSVSVLADRSGNGNNLTQTTNANRGLLTVTRLSETIGRRNTLTFPLTATNACHMVSAVDASDRTQTVIFTGIAHTLPNPGTLVGCDGDGGRQIRLTSGGRIEIVKAGVAFMFQPSAALTVTAGTPFCIAVKFDTSAIKVWLNNVTPEANADATTFTAARVTYLNVKIASGDVQAGNWAMGECLIYPTALSDGDVDLVRAYLMAKWGI